MTDTSRLNSINEFSAKWLSNAPNLCSRLRQFTVLTCNSSRRFFKATIVYSNPIRSVNNTRVPDDQNSCSVRVSDFAIFTNHLGLLYVSHKRTVL